MRIRPLKWVKLHNIEGYTALTVLGSYWIICENPDIKIRRRFTINGSNVKAKDDCKSLRAAKAACFADWCERVKPIFVGRVK